ncbi:nickel pincer cofactor biosynthesis protein LarB [Halorubrum ezzemoulense]|uniref:Nickel pincer cofactor biosynthesis protein LarB n=1 Tax=Halorubrum ezzemoulense TaxID=337243 RepID=A0ABT4Z2M6_HALEZ|nr:nickel pincer cofactor biosynthesis protein LarB [Halorubrum ezzemoulense]MDB2244187.1 nickel pincer cofactor biosynthesis protein LarB [Halorubrum ezzemoulense]MDB2252366.1 nickel pincer cofactor biosynthesis protein LarB [Halorubrum ezzemoulense]MDB2277923.1 nickel pincer cofactor biosynthesis protein LarB [Halorubrum ezzemoulense]MDB2286323.1 nickel pincer cofactor biosynthesis protein LarB [Halorubrum ezzemoulense]MDB2289550.1 nickel pincer cofactor biosynthesis protein LarB [Halorubrum
MRETLAALEAGEIGIEEAESRLAGYATTDAGRFDAARERRRGIPEAILAEGKTPAEVAALATTALDTTGRALVTRADEATAAAVASAVGDVGPDATVERDDRIGTVVAHAADFELPSLDAAVAVVAAGTADAPVAGEAAVVAREIGATVDRIDDVGVANLDRIVDQADRVREADAVVVAAGREGALPTVVAGLVDAPVIALPVSTGYGVGGEGVAALEGALQSCSVLTTVNVDAGFVAGAQAGLIARAVDAARAE